MTKDPTYSDEVSPDSLMSDFRGRPIVGILAFTVIVHILLIGVFSIRYLKNEVLGADTSSLSEEERLELAVDEATKALRKIAERHQVSPQDLSERFAGDSRPTTKAKPANLDQQETTLDEPSPGEPSPDEPQSAIEKELQKKEDGPALPNLPSLDEEEDLFK